MKGYLLPAIIFCGLFCVSLLAEEPQASKPAETVDAGNKKCPVSGQPVNGKDSCVHKNTRYNLCKDECSATFSQEPEKYSKVAKDEVDASVEKAKP